MMHLEGSTMGLFQKPPTPEEIERQKRYEASKIRLLELHKTAKTIYYIDEITADPDSHRQLLIGELGKGQLKPEQEMLIYSCEGLPVGTMITDSIIEQTEKHYIVGTTIHILCFPKEEWDSYVPGQMLVQLPADVKPTFE